MSYAKRIAHALLIVLMLLNGSVAVLLWRGTGTSTHARLSTSLPYTLDHRLIATIMPVDTRLRSYPDYPETFDYTSQGSPNEVWVHVWTQNTRRHTFTTYLFFMLPVRSLRVLHLLAVTLPLTLLALSLVSMHRCRFAERARRS